MMSIRGIISNGVIVPIDPLPSNWGEGKTVIALDVESEGGADEDIAIQRFISTVINLDPLEFDPGEEARLDQMLQDSDRQSKEIVRREMGIAK
jgi:hypothetical protein